MLTRFLFRCALLMALCLGTAGHSYALEADRKVELQLTRDADGVFATVALQFDLPEPIQDALSKGVAMYFVEEAEIIAERWYWRDKTVKKTARYMRLTYQPLTRRWRLHVASTPFDEAGMAASLGQTFDSLDEAMAIVKRVRQWKIASADDVSDSTAYMVKFHFRLDASQLPRLMQFAPFGSGGLNLQMSSQLPMPEQAKP